MGALNILRMFCVTDVAALAACGRSTYIDGTVDTYGFEGRTLTIVEFLHSSVIHDSCLVSHGKFGMKGKTDDIRLVFCAVMINL